MSGLIHERSPAQVAYDEAILERVKLGMALMEEKHGAEWVDHIDLKTLNLASGSACVLGQIYGDYEDGEKILFGVYRGWREASRYGFWTDSKLDDLAEGAGAISREGTWNDLTAVWRRELEAVAK